ncbi:alpha/beta fold hydrolase [Domibacillus robiginosus]|uniref:alpha/beta fold hydrolase n=1 Tax=Domibacillus robiginosus TaxID=1071054 RepID=UPI00067A8623|nr:alpha/beta hydrolase [Domibacillus robiginosus]
MDLGSINVPTAIFHGKKDQICPYEFAEEMNKGIPNSHIVPFEQSGHGSFWDKREKFSGELIRFLNS